MLSYFYLNLRFLYCNKCEFNNVFPSQIFKEKDTGKLFTQEASKKLLSHLGDLDMTANAALQTQILVSAM